MNIRSTAGHMASPRPQWIENFARVGLTAKGVVYCIVGALAFMAAFEFSSIGTGAGKKGVFQFILAQPFGKFLLGLVALGLICYSIWRFIEAFYDTEGKGSDAKGIGRRIGYAFSGLVYGALAYLAASMVLGNSSGGGGDSRETLAQKLLAQPFGQWLAGAVALGIIAVGLYQIYRAVSGKYLKKIQASQLPYEVQKTVIRAGKAGYIARGIVWMIIGYLFMKAALQSNPQKAGGSSSAFQFLEDSPYGSYLLGAIALGLICYGVFMFVRARYEVIHT